MPPTPNTPETLEIVPTGAALGAEVRGVDLAHEPPGAVVHAILEAFRAHQVLVFRGQQLTPERQLDVAEWFGPRYRPPPDIPVLGDASQPDVVPVSNFAAGGVLGNAELVPHSDLSFMPVPLLGAMLHAVEVPPRGGETAWANLYQAYDELDADTKAEIEGLRAYCYNPYAGERAVRDVGGPNQKYVAEEIHPFYHPMVRTHPDTGRRSLYVSTITVGIEGWDRERAKPLLRRLREHVDQPHLYYWHEWRPGDVVVWDNRCTNHKRTPVPPDTRRLLHRVQIAGTRPF